MTESISSIDNWESISRFPLDNSSPESSPNVEWFRSTKTGIQIVLCDAPGPLIHLSAVFATHSYTDRGEPHCLEHLCFMGSKRYPYKGVLDLLANRCFADGTNAWTDNDCTAYTVSTAGIEGFLNILPVYLDHLLFPTLNDSAFITEVHHITGKGRDAGVVYNEMEGRERSEDEIVDAKIRKILFPNHPLSKNTGGKLEALRTLDNDMIRDYHNLFYKPENLTLIITGKISINMIIESLKKLEENIILTKTAIEKPPKLDPIPEFTSTVCDKVFFPSDDEESGSVTVAWEHVEFSDFKKSAMISMLFTYLTESAISPLALAFTECDNPLCVEVSSSESVFPKVVSQLDFESASIKTIENIPDRLFSTLKDQLINFDLNRMKDVLERQSRLVKYRVENYPRSLVEDSITYFIYCDENSLSNLGQKGEKSLSSYLNIRNDPLWMLGLKKQDWTNLIKEFLIDPPHIIVTAIPSTDLSKKVQKSDEERVKQTCIDLGEKKLLELDIQLKDAMDMNNRPIPIEKLFKDFPIPDPKKISFFESFLFETDYETGKLNLTGSNSSNSSSSNKSLGNFDNGKELPCTVSFCHTDNSKFYNITCNITTKDLKDNERLFIPLILELLFKSPLKSFDGKITDHETLQRELVQDTVDYSCSVGYSQSDSFHVGTVSNLLTIDFSCENNTFSKCIDWLGRLCFNQYYTQERLIVGIKAMLSSITSDLREGTVVIEELEQKILYKNSGTNAAAMLSVTQHAFLASMLSDLESGNKEKVEKIISGIQDARNNIFILKNIRFGVVGNLKGLVGSADFSTFFSEKLFGNIQRADPYENDFQASEELYSPYSLELTDLSQRRVLLNGLGSTDVGYFQTCAPITGFKPDSLDSAALFLLCEYLAGTESPFWRHIRGGGLAYGANLSVSSSGACITFDLYRCGNVVKAFQAVQKIVMDYSNGESEFENSLLNSTRSTLIYSIISRVSTPQKAANNVLIDKLLKRPGFLQNFLSLINDVTINDLNRVLKKHIVPMFNLSIGTAVMVDSSAKSNDLKIEFEKLFGINVSLQFLQLEDSK